MTQNIVEYKEFIGSVNFSGSDECFYGKIEGINDLVNFEGSSVNELKKAFRDAVDECLELCKEAGKEAYRSVKGSFNIRIEPKLHNNAIYTALKKGISLYQFVADAIKKSIDKKVLNHT